MTTSIPTNLQVNVAQDYGNDLTVDTSTGDLTITYGATLSEQNIIRRLLTAPISVANPPDFLQEPTYGAGLGQFVGNLSTPQIQNKILGLITSQMYLEPTVQQDPAPVIVLTPNGSQLNCQITYDNLLTNSQAVIAFTLPINNFNPATIST